MKHKLEEALLILDGIDTSSRSAHDWAAKDLQNIIDRIELLVEEIEERDDK